MPIQITWFVEDRVILWTVSGTIDNADVKIADAEMIALFEASDRLLIHTLFDFEAVDALPSIVEFLRLKPGFPQHPKNGWNVFAAVKNPIHKMAIAVAGSVFKARVRQVMTFDTALRFLQSVDSSLPDLGKHDENATGV